MNQLSCTISTHTHTKAKKPSDKHPVIQPAGGRERERQRIQGYSDKKKYLSLHFHQSKVIPYLGKKFI